MAGLGWVANDAPVPLLAPPSACLRGLVARVHAHDMLEACCSRDVTPRSVLSTACGCSVLYTRPAAVVLHGLQHSRCTAMCAGTYVRTPHARAAHAYLGGMHEGAL